VSKLPNKTCLWYLLLTDATAPSQGLPDAALAVLPPGMQGQTPIFRTIISPYTEGS